MSRNFRTSALSRIPRSKSRSSTDLLAMPGSHLRSLELDRTAYIRIIGAPCFGRGLRFSYLIAELRSAQERVNRWVRTRHKFVVYITIDLVTGVLRCLNLSANFMMQLANCLAVWVPWTRFLDSSCILRILGAKPKLGIAETNSRLEARKSS